uniref:Uncharacterized protein n=1 Tax=Tanacetum cinerariifolium TaxID=118510 RepID=A0A6L2J3Z8_TANCI|nr:hypothetical protein [Tanacetum cinerariifolium]
MANQEQNPPQQEQPFVVAKQVSFNLEDIILNTNNEVALLYPEHNNKDYFKCVSDFISKCCLRKPFIKSLNMYKEYLAEFCYTAIALEDSKVSFLIPTGVRQWFLTIGYGEEVFAKGTLRKNLLSPRDGNKTRTRWGPDPQARIDWEIPKLTGDGDGDEESLNYDGDGDGDGDGAKKQGWGCKESTIGGSSKALTSSKTSDSKKRKKSSSAMDSNPNLPLVSTPVDTGMHKEDQQATGGATSLGVTSEARSNPQLSSGMPAFNLNKPIYSTSFIIHSESASRNDASVIFIAKVDPGKSDPCDFVPQQQGVSFIARQVEEEEASSTIKLRDLAKLVSNVQPSFKYMDSPKDDPVNVVDDSDEDKEDELHTTKNAKTEDTLVLKSSSPRYSQIQGLTNQVLVLQSQKHKLKLKKNKAEAKAALLKAQPSFSNVGQLNKLLINSLQTEFSKILSAHNFSNSLTTKPKDLPSKFNELTKKVKGLKKQVHELKIELTGDLKEIPIKLEDFTKTINISKEAEKENTNSGSNDDDETHVTSSMVESSTTKKLKKFCFINKDGKHIHLTEEHINQQKKIEKEAKAKAAKHEREVRKAKLVDLLGPDVGQITLKVYREDGTSKVIPNFKASDLHHGEWREIMKACPNRTGKGWKTIYGQIKKRMDYLRTTESELGINLDIPLSEQDPLNKLNDLANKKRKHVDDIRDYFKANKLLESSVQYEDHLPGIVLNEHVLGMIMFNSYHRQDFVTIEDLKDLSNTML